MTPRLNWEGTTLNKNILTKKGLAIGVERLGQTMPLEFIDLNSTPVAALNCDNRKAIGKEKLRKTRFDKSKKDDNIECRKKN